MSEPSVNSSATGMKTMTESVKAFDAEGKQTSSGSVVFEKQ
jgi:hypothetical protein